MERREVRCVDDTQVPVHRDTTAESEGNPRVARMRRAVCEAGRELVLASGPSVVTHAAVAAAARVSRTTLYKYWPTRVELLVEICHVEDKRAVVVPSGDVRTDLVGLVSDVVESLSDPDSIKMFASMVAQAQWDPEAREVRASLAAAGLEDLTTILDAAVAAEQLPHCVDPQRAVGRLLGPFVLAALVTDEPLDMGEVEPIVDDWLASVRK